MDFGECLRLHIRSHQLLLPQDIIKFSFQAAYGAEHILKDTKAAKEYFFSEYSETAEADVPLTEELNEKYCRVNFAAWKKRGYYPYKLLDMFLESSAKPQADDADITAYFEAAVCVIREENGSMLAEFCEERDRYLRDGIRPVHHSSIYRENYSPAYRVIRTELLNTAF